MVLSKFSRNLGLAVVGMGLMGAQIVPVQAAMVGTQQVVQAEQSRVDRAQLLAALEREDVRSQLEAMGVDQTMAAERVAAMTDAEIAELNQRIGELPAGGDALGVILVIFLVFVITDVIGATDIFPFINPVR
ncbi:MAG: PA2779 family protein [Gammaproteobacteria bacterium]|nr:PA2779 family protein [Gammaproteobacteria bacterium]